MMTEAMGILNDIQYSNSSAYESRLRTLETIISFSKAEEKENFEEEYIQLVIRNA